MQELDIDIKYIKVIIPSFNMEFTSPNYKIGEKIITLNLVSTEKIWFPTPQDVILRCISSDALYQAKTEVLTLQHFNDTATLMIKRPQELKKIQNRKFFRVNIDTDATISYQKNGIQTIKCKTIDISAGGIKLLLKEKINFPDSVTINTLLDDKKISLEARFVNYYNKKRILEAAFEFINISDKLADEIHSFCFKKQLQDNKLK